jgi:hypothetical protein
MRFRSMSRAKNSAAGITGRRKGKPVADEREHFYICEVCGQAVDKLDLGEVFHHEQPGHEQLPENG